MNHTLISPTAPKFWVKCSKCQAFTLISQQRVFRYIAQMFRLDMAVLDARYAKAAHGESGVKG